MTPVTLDLSGLKCPLPALRTRKALQSLAAGERLEVITTDPLAVIDIPALIDQSGDTVEIIAQAEGRATFLITKRGSPV